AMFVCVSMMQPLPPSSDGTRLGLRSIREGMSFLRGDSVLQSTFLIDLDAMIFGMPRALFPAIAIDRFHGGAGVLGLLVGAPAAVGTTKVSVVTCGLACIVGVLVLLRVVPQLAAYQAPEPRGIALD